VKARLHGLFNAMPLFWKVYAFIVALLIFVVGLLEIVFEPLAIIVLTDICGGFQAWHEAVLWGVSIVFPSLACGYILSRILTKKLGKIANASKSLANGNLEVHLPVTGNKKDAFDVLSSHFNEMADVIKAQRRNERQLLANISHELRSPLTRISVATDLLERRYKEDEIVEITRRLGKEVARMNDMISLLLEQAKDKVLAFGENSLVNVSGILCELADDFAFQGEIANKSVKTDIERNLTVYGNTQLLERMFGNILANAIFYSPSNSSIHVAAQQQNGNIYINIKDFGPGVPEGELGEIFRAFYRVDGSRARTSGGVGLGLAIAREAAIQHGGNIVACNTNPGLSITVTLPIYGEEQND
jgi:two-component system sensor histidine kinase CpxA